METLSTQKVLSTAVTNATTYAAAFGTTNDAAAVWNFAANYDAALHSAGALAGGFTYQAAAAVGTYNIFAGDLVSYLAPSTFYVSYVKAISTTSGSETITINGAADADVVLQNNATSDVVNEYNRHRGERLCDRAADWYSCDPHKSHND
jgi:hypothetical protein